MTERPAAQQGPTGGRTAGAAAFVGDLVQLAEDERAGGGAGEPVDVEELCGRLLASRERINAAWDGAHLAVRGGDPSAAAGARGAIWREMDALVEDVEQAEERLLGTPDGAVLRGAFREWKDGFRGKINLGHLAGRAIRGSRMASILIGNDPYEHLEVMVGQLDDVARLWHRLRTTTDGAGITGVLRRLPSLEGSRFLFFEAMMEATPASELAFGRGMGGTARDLVRVFEAISMEFLGDLAERSHEVARYENRGGDPERIDAVMRAARNAEGADQQQLVRLTDQLRDAGERQLFLDQLQVAGAYNRVLTEAGEHVRGYLLDGTNHGWDASDEVLSAAEGFGVELFLETFHRACEVAGISEEEIQEVVGTAHTTLRAIVDDPGTFISTLTGAAKDGFDGFVERFPEHLGAQFSDWLGDQLGGTVTMPASLEAGDLLALVLEVLGLDRAALQEHVARNFGEGAGDAFDRAWGYIEALITGGLGGLWDAISGDLADLASETVDAIKGWLMRNVVEAAARKVATFLVPGGGLVEAIQAAWEMYGELKDNIAEIWGVVRALVDGMAQIVSGDGSAVAGAVESALAAVLRLAIGVLARWTGVDGVAETVEAYIERVRGRVEGAIDRLVERIRERDRGGDEAAAATDPQPEAAPEAAGGEQVDPAAVASLAAPSGGEQAPPAGDRPALDPERERFNRVVSRFHRQGVLTPNEVVDILGQATPQARQAKLDEYLERQRNISQPPDSADARAAWRQYLQQVEDNPQLESAILLDRRDASYAVQLGTERGVSIDDSRWICLQHYHPPDSDGEYPLNRRMPSLGGGAIPRADELEQLTGSEYQDLQFAFSQSMQEGRPWRSEILLQLPDGSRQTTSFGADFAGESYWFDVPMPDGSRWRVDVSRSQITVQSDLPGTSPMHPRSLDQALGLLVYQDEQAREG